MQTKLAATLTSADMKLFDKAKKKLQAEGKKSPGFREILDRMKIMKQFDKTGSKDNGEEKDSDKKSRKRKPMLYGPDEKEGPKGATESPNAGPGFSAQPSVHSSMTATASYTKAAALLAPLPVLPRTSKVAALLRPLPRLPKTAADAAPSFWQSAGQGVMDAGKGAYSAGRKWLDKPENLATVLRILTLGGGGALAGIGGSHIVGGSKRRGALLGGGIGAVMGALGHNGGLLTPKTEHKEGDQ